MSSDGNIQLWNRLTGSPEEFTMRNRAFNYVCVITSFILVFSLGFDIYICQSVMSAVLAGFLLLLGVMYYFSRYKKKYKVSIAVFVICSYGALVLNYFVNEGINGPTLALFTITLVFVSILAEPKWHRLVIVAHTAIAAALLATEYYAPGLVPATYPNRTARFLDWGSTCIITLTFLYGLTNFLRKHYDAKRQLADERASEIEEQNERILEQNYSLERLDAEKTKLFSIVSHDLKGPVDALHEYLYLLSEDALPESERKEIHARLTDQTKYTSDLLENLMTWARSQMNGVAANIQPVNVSMLAADIIANKNSTASRKGILLSSTVDPAICVAGDKEMLKIVLRNLVNNAIKFTNNGGAITISAEEEADDVLIVVSDNGIGIDPARKQDVFTLKTNPTFGTNREKGVGLGLAMCKEFVDYQGGSIWFESEPGKGSRFYVALPKSDEPEITPPQTLVTSKAQVKAPSR